MDENEITKKLLQRRKEMQEILRQDLKIISDIVESRPDDIVGYNHEVSKYNKGVSITLKREN